MMKKRLLIASVLLAVAACTKQAPDFPGHFVSVTFEVGTYVGNFPTKGMADAIAATLPAALDLYLTNTDTGTSYTAQTGRAVELPEGTYSVTGGFTPDATKAIYGNSLYLSNAPKVSVSQDVTITAGMGTCTLLASYESAALVTISDEVQRWTGATSNKEGFDVDALETGIYRWTFITGDFSTNRYFHTYLKPKDGGEQVGYTIVTNPSMQTTFSDALVVDFGKWYLLRAGEGEIQAGAFAVEWPVWTQG